MTNNITIGILLGVISGFCFALLPILHQQYKAIPERARILGQFLFALIAFSFFTPLSQLEDRQDGLVGVILPGCSRNLHCAFIVDSGYHPAINHYLKSDFLSDHSHDNGDQSFLAPGADAIPQDFGSFSDRFG
jgi:hypothetical protein